jgi:hypothetical protein
MDYEKQTNTKLCLFVFFMPRFPSLKSPNRLCRKAGMLRYSDPYAISETSDGKYPERTSDMVVVSSAVDQLVGVDVVKSGGSLAIVVAVAVVLLLE